MSASKTRTRENNGVASKAQRKKTAKKAKVLDEIVTSFLFDTCLLRLEPRIHALHAATCSAMVSTLTQAYDKQAALIPMTTGSVAEFYIEPMLPYVGDIDVMFHLSTQLAIPRRHPPPTQLPDEFDNAVQVFEIVDSHLPGYVYLELRYLLTECTDNDAYRCAQCHDPLCLSNCVIVGNKMNIHGPAVYMANTFIQLSIDAVPCVRCLSWPPQAADLPTRHRNHGWPDSATVDRVVGNGCDLVPVAHRQCRQHEWMGDHQWRLSFSRAEIVLLNSWMPVQQIVYHMLRVFIKAERLTDNAVNYSRSGTLSNYHIKTLMLWASEQRPMMWWTGRLTLVHLVVKLLGTLSEWLADARCPHYFIHDCNLIDNNSFETVEITELISTELKSIDEMWLAKWFIDNYVRKCSLICPHRKRVKRFFADGDSKSLGRAASVIGDWRLNTALEDLWSAFSYAEIGIASSDFSPTVRFCVRSMTQLAAIDKRLPIYFTAVTFLRVAHEMWTTGFREDLIDALATVTGQFMVTHRHNSHHRSQLSLDTALKLMKEVTVSSRSTVQLTEIELSKAYLHRALRCKDSDSDSIYCLANVYLAVLYYTTGQYQTAIDHCTLVMRSQDHSQCSSYVVQGELLPKIDDNIDNVLGLTVFYEYVRTGALNQRQTSLVSVCTTELFARDLCRRCISITQKFSDDQFEHCGSYYFRNRRMFIADVLALKSIIRRYYGGFVVTDYHRPKFSDYELNSHAPDLVELLQKSAVEHLTTYRQLEARQFGSVARIVTTDFEALYAYKNRDYRKCLELSRHAVNWCRGNTPNFLAFPVFIQLLDDDIVSLTALMLITNSEYRDLIDNIRIHPRTMSLYLMTQCQLKLSHSVKSFNELRGYVKAEQKKCPDHRSLDRLTLTLTRRKILSCLASNCKNATPRAE